MTPYGKGYETATMGGEMLQVVAPRHFYAADTGDLARGAGLYCRVDLEPGDVWWVHDFTDRRFVERVIPWPMFEQLTGDERRMAEIYGYIDAASGSVVICAEPFRRVNHADHGANSYADDFGNSVVCQFIPAGVEITQPYDYELIQSLLWKFPALREHLSANELADRAFLFSPVSQSEVVRAFLRNL